MKKLTETVQSGDWKNEKHVPVIHVENNGEELVVKAFVGEEIAHPNTLEHHISWIKLFFQPEGAKFPIEIGSYEFKVHGEEELFTKPEVVSTLKTTKKGILYAMSYCNIHGLWENSQEV
ncbi:class II SORL domain-containing protein [Peptoniphilus sp. oral taxon 386]|uniref:class II SORL domain-containing protein n=1 Tax=Peptoniphilus sp. oral taxon 386 TaxID=652713 RepID=UPI0001DA9EE1|nr:class II SORL domain-containing protein [Peptoniphilus sp. oral taxon 386]EFI41527.1 superoxide reductase [Peptoniphilus sp. oral taxon 386 str. F0131]